MVPKYTDSLIFFFAALFCSDSSWAIAKYSQRFGVRATIGALGYTAVASKAAGIAIPLQIEGSYSITNAVELLAGFRGAYSLPLVGTAAFSIPFAAAIGLRYYYNVNEPIKAFNTIQLMIAVDRFGIEAQPLWGIQWDINEYLALFGQGGFGFVYGQRTAPPYSTEVNLSFSIATGLHYHF